MQNMAYSTKSTLFVHNIVCAVDGWVFFLILITSIHPKMDAKFFGNFSQGFPISNFYLLITMVKICENHQFHKPCRFLLAIH